jgi:HD-GYP domain-containing protein (c-di-GMP phosphodiesterase class II)
MYGDEQPFLTAPERILLSIPRGSLNEDERKEIESHVVHTFEFLQKIPWTGSMKNIPTIARWHHEKLDGRGYPDGKRSEDLPIQSKMMTVSDIFDALTAQDRPYKPAVPRTKALDILLDEGKTGHIDLELVQLFIDAKIFEHKEQNEK